MRILRSFSIKRVIKDWKRAFYACLGGFWHWYDAKLGKERAKAMVEVRSLGKRVSFKPVACAGLRLGYLYPDADLSQFYVNGKIVGAWYKIKASDQVVVILRPAGGFFGDLVQAVVGAALIFASGGTGFLFNAGVGLVVAGATSAVSKLLFPQNFGAQSQNDFDASNERPEITGAQNTVSKSIIPVLLGKNKITPFYGQNPYRVVGDGTSTNRFLQYFIPTYDNIAVEQEKLGNTLITDFSGTYLDITRSFGGGSFIGNANVKVSQKNEQLTFNADEFVSQSYEKIYNQASMSTTVTYDFVLLFTDVDLTAFPDKTFKVDIEVLDATSQEVTLTQEFVITSGDLVLVSGDDYTYTGSHTFSQAIIELTSSNLSPVSDTRISIQENTNLMLVEVQSQDVTTDDFTDNATPAQGVNRYAGVLSESLDTSPANTTDVDLIFSFPQGSFRIVDDGTRRSRLVDVQIEYKTQTGSYQPLNDATLYIRGVDGTKQPLSGSTTTVDGAIVTFGSPDNLNAADELFYRTIGLTLPADTYTFRVRSAELAAKDTRHFGFINLAEINYHVAGDIVDESLLPKLTQYSVNAIAYTQLSGQLNEFNFIATAKIPNWNGTDWSTVEATQNPAAVVRYILTDVRINPRAEAVDLIDNDSLVELHEWCELNGYIASGFIYEQQRILNIIETILSNCEAAVIINDGKYCFVIDDDRKPVKNQITPHNSFNFKWTPTLGKTTDAVRVSYVDAVDYTDSEFTLYYYDGAVHETPKVGTSDADYEIIRQEAEYTNDIDHLKTLYTKNLQVLQEKRNVFEFDVNLEGLTMQLYDRILVANSVNMTNSSSGLIKEVITSGNNLTGFKLYSSVDIASGDKITIRSIDIPNSSLEVQSFNITNTGNTDIVEIAPLVYNGNIKGKSTLSGFSGVTWDYDGDLFEIGQDRITECVVLNIRYKEDLTATITAREA